MANIWIMITVCTDDYFLELLLSLIQITLVLLLVVVTAWIQWGPHQLVI